MLGENPVIIILNFRASLSTLSFSVLLFKDGLLLKLCDFGTAKKLEHTLTNAVGTIRYMAPEVIRGTCMLHNALHVQFALSWCDIALIH